MTEPTPTPVFHRFPGIQLVFCIACLSMTAWTWMRYSYCWNVSTDDLVIPNHFVDTPHGQRVVPLVSPANHPFIGSYVTLRGYSLDVKDNVALVLKPNTGYEGGPRNLVHLGRGGHEAQGQPERGPVAYKGRVWFNSYNATMQIDASADRFTGASVGGLVVGAMGCFIFGLYLRGWQRERKVLASGPQQDMIA